MQLAIISVVLFSLVFTGPGWYQQPRPGRPASSQSVADRGWPRGYSLPSEAQIVLYQPQIASWENQKHLVAFAALSQVAKSECYPALGTIELESSSRIPPGQRWLVRCEIKII